MNNQMRKTGVEVVGDMPWGTHFCLFYETRMDLLETTVSYCKAGLENQEFCLWVVAEPFTVARRYACTKSELFLISIDTSQTEVSRLLQPATGTCTTVRLI